MSDSFQALGLMPELLDVLGEIGFDRPTPVQAGAIPELLAGRDLLGQARTGSGKTAAFALPILQRVVLGERRPQALVVCPTRELSAQVAREVRTLGRRLGGLVVLELVGGQPIRSQLDGLERGVHVVVGTPGRLLDHLERDSLDVGALATVVLDEADRLLDMGFGVDVERLLRAAPHGRQTVLFSATLPRSVRGLARAHQRDDAVSLTIDEPDEVQASDVRQLRIVAEPEQTFAALCQALMHVPHESALVFCNFKASVRDLAAQLADAGIVADRLDGDMDQFRRDQVLARFRNHSLRLLIATDVAGRGLDVDGLDLVVNYELPQQPDVYVHRIGRTGRAGAQGVAISLMTPRQEGRLRTIEERVGAPLEELPLRPLDDGVGAQLREVLKRRTALCTVLISGGRKHKVRKGDILGALTGEAGGLSGAEIGRIELQDRLTYVAVARSRARHAVDQLNAGRIKGRRFKATLIDG